MKSVRDGGLKLDIASRCIKYLLLYCLLVTMIAEYTMWDVMKESAQAALSYIRSRQDKFELAEDFYEKNDIHVHFPEGAVPKDGPSAGITMATAIVSGLTGRKIRSDVAMTGEITIRGNVLAIGGLKEKVLAAYREGIRTIVLPKENERDIEDIPESVREKLEFVPVENMDKVLETALCE